MWCSKFDGSGSIWVAYGEVVRVGVNVSDVDSPRIVGVFLVFLKFYEIPARNFFGAAANPVVIEPIVSVEGFRKKSASRKNESEKFLAIGIF